jgi:hypothetical protein
VVSIGIRLQRGRVEVQWKRWARLKLNDSSILTVQVSTEAVLHASNGFNVDISVYNWYVQRYSEIC